ncbi:MAG TPA: proline racemase family protein [Gemmatimonadales bacterium]
MQTPRKILAVDAHAAGEPGRVIVGGVPDVPGYSMFEKMRYLERHADGLRKLMLREPRGYPALCCNLLLPPTRPEADAGFVIMEQTEYPPMSGSNTICVATVLIETGMVDVTEPVTELTLEAPAGLIRIRAMVEDGMALAISFENVPSFATHLDAALDVPYLGTVTVDVAYGGMFYVIADAEALGISLRPENGAEIARVGAMLRQAAAEQLPVSHPEQPEISGVSIAQLSGAPTVRGAHRKNAVVVSTGAVDWDRLDTWTGALDRCPCGTGTSAKMAVLHAKGLLALDTDFVHEGPLGTTFTGRLVRTTRVGDYDAVVPVVTGRGWITGRSEFILDRSDPFPEGYTMGDLW